jgi:hypothetical protein
LATATKKTVQLRMSAALYTRARHVVQEEEEISSFNDFAVKAIKQALRKIDEARIDAAFARLGQDEKYMRTTEKLSKSFAKNDWETLKISEGK